MESSLDKWLEKDNTSTVRTYNVYSTSSLLHLTFNFPEQTTPLFLHIYGI